MFAPEKICYNLNEALLVVKNSALLWSLCQTLIVWTRVGAGYFIRCVHPRGLASSPTLLLELQIGHIRLVSFTHPFMAEADVEYANVAVPVTQVWGLLIQCLKSCPWQINQGASKTIIPAWRLESSIVPTRFVPPQLHYSAASSVFFRIRSCQLGPYSHSFPRYNLIRVSIHSICMALLLTWKTKPVKTRAKRKNPKLWHRLTQSTTRGARAK